MAGLHPGLRPWAAWAGNAGFLAGRGRLLGLGRGKQSSTADGCFGARAASCCGLARRGEACASSGKGAGGGRGGIIRWLAIQTFLSRLTATSGWAEVLNAFSRVPIWRRLGLGLRSVPVRELPTCRWSANSSLRAKVNLLFGPVPSLVGLACSMRRARALRPRRGRPRLPQALSCARPRSYPEQGGGRLSTVFCWAGCRSPCLAQAIGYGGPTSLVAAGRGRLAPRIWGLLRLPYPGPPGRLSAPAGTLRHSSAARGW